MCREHRVADATALLLERAGDAPGALALTLDALGARLEAAELPVCRLLYARLGADARFADRLRAMMERAVRAALGAAPERGAAARPEIAAYVGEGATLDALVALVSRKLTASAEAARIGADLGAM